MKDYLEKQMQEKRHRENIERSHNDEQAVIWRTDKRNYEEEEKKLT